MESNHLIELREISMQNFRECIELSVADHQKGFVASNMYSLAEAKADGVSTPRAVYAGGKMVGFTMYWCDPESGTGYIDRLMVADGQQGKGYGRSTMNAVIEILRATPGCQRIQTSYEPTNYVAESLYESLGFRRNGEFVGDEVVVVLELST